MNVGEITNHDLVDVSQLHCPSFATKQAFNHNSRAWMDNGSLSTKQQHEGITKSLQNPTKMPWDAVNL